MLPGFTSVGVGGSAVGGPWAAVDTTAQRTRLTTSGLRLAVCDWRPTLVLVISFRQLDVRAVWIGDVGDVQTDGGHLTIRRVELDALRFELLAERLEVLDL